MERPPKEQQISYEAQAAGVNFERDSRLDIMSVAAATGFTPEEVIESNRRTAPQQTENK